MKIKTYSYFNIDIIHKIGIENGLTEKVLDNFKKSLDEIEFDLEVDETTGNCMITHVNNIELNYNDNKENLYIAYFDGASKPNPGLMKVGFLIKDFRGQTIIEGSKNMGRGTNNQSEYLALLEVVKQIIKLKIKNVQIKGDSQLVVNQINSKWKCNNLFLKGLNQQIQGLLTKIPNWSLEWVRRNQNKEADLLSN